MMLGRDVSMPNAVSGEPDLSSDERERALDFASTILRDLASRDPRSDSGLTVEAALVLSRAVLRYCPAPTPSSVPVLRATSTDLTMPSGGVVMSMVEQESSGVPEDTGDDLRTSQVGIKQTAMYEIDVHGPMDRTRR